MVQSAVATASIVYFFSAAAVGACPPCAIALPVLGLAVSVGFQAYEALEVKLDPESAALIVSVKENFPTTERESDK